MSDTVPNRLAMVIGTGTEVGKTWVAAGALGALRAEGLSVAARKPAQSFSTDDATTDADVLADASGENPTEVCLAHRWYETPLAPPMAADALGRPPFTIADLVDEVVWPVGCDIGIVEAAGGVRSPLASDAPGDAVTMIAALGPDIVVIVANAELGTINGIRLTFEALEPILDRRDGMEVVVFLNQFNPDIDLHRRNLAWLRDHDRFTVVVEIDELVTLLRPA